MIRNFTFHYLFAGSLQLKIAPYQITWMEEINREDVSSGKQADKQLPALIMFNDGKGENVLFVA